MKKSSAEILAESKKKLDLALKPDQLDEDWATTAAITGFIGAGVITGGGSLGAALLAGFASWIAGAFKDISDHWEARDAFEQEIKNFASSLDVLFKEHKLKFSWKKLKYANKLGQSIILNSGDGTASLGIDMYAGSGRGDEQPYDQNWSKSPAIKLHKVHYEARGSFHIEGGYGNTKAAGNEEVVLNYVREFLQTYADRLRTQTPSVSGNTFESRKQKSKKSISEGKKPRITKEFRQVVAGIAQKNGFNSIVEYSDAESAIIKIVKKDKEYFTTKIEVTGDKVKLSFEGDSTPNPITGKVSEWVSVGEGWRDPKTLFAVKSPSVIQRYAKHLHEKLRSLKESKAKNNFKV